MKKIYNIFFLACLVILGACGDDRSSPGVINYEGTVLGMFTEGRVNGINLYYDALVKTGLDSRLSEATERTFLVPNNAAMQAALQSGGFLSVEAADVDFLTTIINNHTFAGTTTEDEFTKSVLTAESGAQVYVSIASDIVFNAQATISDGNNSASNGVVHVIDFPILVFPASNIATIISDSAAAVSPEFTLLNAALAATGLDGTLGGTTEFTLFAPTDAAFNAAGYADVAAINAEDVAVLTEVLQNHVIAGRFLSLELASGRAYTPNGAAGTAKGIDLDVSDDAIEIEIDGGTSDTESVNTLATNGVIHRVDAVISPEDYVIESAGVTGTPFGTALGASAFDYTALLSTEDEYTALVPTGYAGGNTQAELDAYIFEGTVSIEGAAGTRIESIGGQQYFIGADDDNLRIYGATGSTSTFSAEDESVYNGNYSTLSAASVTPLPNMSTTSVIISTDSLKLYAEALRFLEVDSVADAVYLALQNSELESVYRDAFDAAEVFDQTTIAAGDFDGLIANIESADAATLAAVIDRHILTALFFSADLEADQEYSNRAGETLVYGTVSIGATDDTGFIINDDNEITVVEIVSADITGLNGVVHVLEETLPEL